jgi:pimeloyl-ACP methyl ester carboxylesterase
MEPAMMRIALLLSDSITAAIAQTPPGRLVDVGGYRLHLYCTGEGSPAVILIGGFSFDWALVQPKIAQRNLVCSYDAAGNAWSDRAPRTTCADHVADIHRLLKTARVSPPYVLAGFSTGALFARLYAKENPDDVAAMVLIDHAFLPHAAPPPPVSTGPDSPPTVISTVPIQFGVDDEPGFERLPEANRNLHHWAMSRNPDLPTADLAEACAAQIGNAHLGNLPLLVVSTANDTRGYRALQTELLALSQHSKQVMAARSFHSIEISEPEIVIDAILQATQASK